MSITSLGFAGFVLLLLAVYYLAPRRTQVPILLAASYLFCALIDWRFLCILLLATLAGLMFGRGVGPGVRSRRVWLALGIAAHVGILAFFKYNEFFLPRVLKLLRLLQLPAPEAGLALLLPAGLSFYTLQAISYLVDIYQGKSQPASNPVDFALYMAYFPRLLAGPIERAGAFLAQLDRSRRVDNAVLTRSLALIAVGLARKTLVAEALRSLAGTRPFHVPGEYSGPQLIAAVIGYAAFVYNDFAGYTSLMRGVSGLFGIELTSNFNLPFLSRNFTELWTRWHISLSAWLRDYIYYPTSRALLRRDLSGRGLLTVVAPPLLTMAASGLWHGASLNLLVWGVINGAFMAGERLLSLSRPATRPDRQPKWRQWLGRIVVTLLALLAFVPFEAPLPKAWQFWRGMFVWASTALPDARLLLPMTLGAAIDWAQHRSRDELVFLKWPRWLQGLALALLVLGVFLATRAGAQRPFVYQDF